MSQQHATLDERYIVPGLRRGLEALRLFSRERTSLSAPEIATALDLPRATVFRLLRTLEMMGFLQRADAENRYQLGPSVLGIGFDYLASLDVVDVGRVALADLRDRSGLSAHMAIRDGRDIVYVARYPARAAVSGSVHVGTRLPAHATVTGRALLACLSDAEVRALYGRKALTRFSVHTPRSVDALLALLREDRARGYCAGQAYFEAGVTAIATTVRDRADACVAAVNLTAVGQPLDVDRLHGELRMSLCAAAARISAWLNGAPPPDGREPGE